MSRLSDQQSKQLAQIANQAAKRSGRAIAKLFGGPIDIKVHDIHSVSIEEMADILGHPETPVSTTFLKITGDLAGFMLVVLPQKTMRRVLKLLIGRSKPIDEFARSALKETGSIIAGSFLAEISDRLKIHVLTSVPALSVDMLRATIDPVSAAVAEWAEWAVIFEVGFDIDNLPGHFLVIIEPAEAAKILEKL